MASSSVINLASYPKMVAANGKKTLAELFSIAEVRASFPDFVRSCAGLSDAQIMSRALFNAVWTDALWRGCPDPSQTGGILLSRNVITVHPGAWWINDYIHYAFGTYIFPNSGTGNADYGGDVGGCEILHWREQWVGAPTNRNGERILFGAYHAGRDDFNSYSEGVSLQGGFRLNGRCGNWRDTTQPRVVGFEAWDFGDPSGFELAHIHYCDIGKRIARGTPFNASGIVSAFSNTEAGVELMGVGNATFAVISMDDNPRGIQMTAGYGRPNTANVNIGTIKSEWAVTPKDQGRTWKPQAFRFGGKFKVRIGLMTHASGAWGNALFILDPDANLGASSLEVGTIDIFANAGTEVLVHDTVAGVAWKFDPRITGFRWTNATGVSTLTSWPVQAEQIPAPHKNQLGYNSAAGQFNRTAGTPTWSDATGTGGSTGGTTPPPNPNPTPTPTPLTLVWGTGFAGTNVRTLVATTGASITVDATWKGCASLVNGIGTTQTNTQFPLALSSVRRIVWRGLTVSTTVKDWNVLCSAVKLKADGTVLGWDGNTVLGKVAPGVKGDLVVDFPAPVELLHILGAAGQPCAPCSIDAIEVYK